MLILLEADMDLSSGLESVSLDNLALSYFCDNDSIVVFVVIN
jgi:hypothetical protein